VQEASWVAALVDGKSDHPRRLLLFVVVAIAYQPSLAEAGRYPAADLLRDRRLDGYVARKQGNDAFGAMLISRSIASSSSRCGSFLISTWFRSGASLFVVRGSVVTIRAQQLNLVVSPFDVMRSLARFGRRTIHARSTP
jgi:hypothetical protein